ncbi:hypothetical protein A2188_02125 [Candidatus Woesebacteria bacterium RIFOXYA1_FULL_43_9]|uniref:DUF4878 domain-containing protein n=1 Tax=Candidatus Woesebacteria bacterium RIFOXYA1_FULL_43_9 TaxID=1802534 RepID=A0A1F8CLZ3_9BACT|nr:MAG: hypothetical protein A2188_02125 [Candidatus Woesebacteria bacterium RIFOXYA1_FULL_43_9]
MKRIILAGIILGTVLVGLLTVRFFLGRPQDVINVFANLINEGKITEAKSLLKIESDGWNNFSEFRIKSLKETGDNVYEVDFEVVLKEDLQNLPIPNYGWVNGVNKRWITVAKIGDSYKITGIGTGP